MKELMKQIEGTELISSEELKVKYGGKDGGTTITAENGCNTCKKCTQNK